ncbi:hypothetical protein V1478_002018 [Vespula squamosa]|uniref:Uncharacterized protein n=1 Tax=Vespula squamosa TaxID=30214 RepID=A0ABD2BYS6_VESSQ
MKTSENNTPKRKNHRVGLGRTDFSMKLFTEYPGKDFCDMPDPSSTKIKRTYKRKNQANGRNREPTNGVVTNITNNCMIYSEIHTQYPI